MLIVVIVSVIAVLLALASTFTVRLKLKAKASNVPRGSTSTSTSTRGSVRGGPQPCSRKISHCRYIIGPHDARWGGSCSEFMYCSLLLTYSITLLLEPISLRNC